MDLYSLNFATFFFIVIAVYYIVPVRFRWTILLAASYYFYGSFKIQYLGLIVFSTLITYTTALFMDGRQKKNRKKHLLLISIICNMGLLFVFKYFNFFQSSLINAFSLWEIPYGERLLHLVVPVGISFYIFQLVSYSVDVYHGHMPPEKHLGVFALYVAFFPKLLAGPIERAKQFLPQLHEGHQWDWGRATNGFKLIVWGLFKKLVVADRLAVFVDLVFANPGNYEGPSLALATVLYSFQIYCDFSGYTDVAIGASQVLGFKLMDNFDRPYSARSIAEFWRRWHISFSTWLRDYLYIPLGGNRVMPVRLYINLVIVFLVCGFWHGANWTFIEWGLIHGLYLIVGLASQGIRSKITHALGLDRIPAFHRGLQVFTTFILVSLAWVFFRAESLYDAIYVVTHLHTGWADIFAGNKLGSILFLEKPKVQLIIALCSLVFVWFIHFIETHDNMRNMLSKKPFYLRWAIYYVMLISVLLLYAQSSQRFIYFQF